MLLRMRTHLSQSTYKDLQIAASSNWEPRNNAFASKIRTLIEVKIGLNSRLQENIDLRLEQRKKETTII